MTRSISFARLTAANVPVLNPRSVFVVFINEVTNASRRVITWPHDPRVSFSTLVQRDRKKKKKKNERSIQRIRKRKRKKERKKESAAKWTSTQNYPPWRAGLEPGL